MIKKNLTTFLLVISATLFCCDTPVFRYAMERWAPSPYQIKVLHSRELNSNELEAIELLISSSKSKRGNGNFYLETVDLNRQKLPTVSTPPKHPVEIQVSYPLDSRLDRCFFSAPLTAENVNRIIDSSIREKICKHLTDGSPAVWLFFESTNIEKNQKAFETLKQNLAECQQAEAIPQLTDTSGNPKLNYFPTVVISKDSSEKFLKQMLLSVEPELLELDKPIVFPIYGQGRALLALIGDGINRKMIKSQAGFVMGKCSCVVKGENPGVDMLFSCDWSKNLGKTWIDEEPAPKVSGFDGFIETIELPPLDSEPELVKDKTEPKSIQNDHVLEDNKTNFAYVIILASLTIFVLIMGTIIIVFRKKS